MSDTTMTTETEASREALLARYIDLLPSEMPESAERHTGVSSYRVYPDLRPTGRGNENLCLAVLTPDADHDVWSQPGWAISDNRDVPDSLHGKRGWWYHADLFAEHLACKEERDGIDASVIGDLRERLGRALVDLSAARDETREARRRHEQDVSAIGSALLEEAESRNWCGEYDRVIDRLNGDLNVPLPVREREYEVEVQVTYTMTVTVEASDADAAREMVEDGTVQIDTSYSTYDDLEIVDVTEA